MRSEPWAEARTRARSCVRSTSGWASPSRRPRRPRRPSAAIGRAAEPDMTLVEVERPNGHAPRLHRLEQMAVGLVLDVFRRRVERLAGEEELRTVETDAVGPGLLQEGQVGQELEIGVEAHRDAVRVVSGSRAALATPARRKGLAETRSARRDLLRLRGDADFPAGAVQDQGGSRGDTRRQVVQADDGRHMKGARQDGRVVRAAAGIHGKAAHARPVQLRRERRQSARRRPAPRGRRCP